MFATEVDLVAKWGPQIADWDALNVLNCFEYATLECKELRNSLRDDDLPHAYYAMKQAQLNDADTRQRLSRNELVARLSCSHERDSEEKG